jgi:hypothetical protein
VDLWNLALPAIFFCAMGTFAGAAALYLTSTPVRPLAHQTAEIVLFCLFAIALFAVIATLRQTTQEITPKRPRASLRLDFGSAPSLVRHHYITTASDPLLPLSGSSGSDIVTLSWMMRQTVPSKSLGVARARSASNALARRWARPVKVVVMGVIRFVGYRSWCVIGHA